MPETDPFLATRGIPSPVVDPKPNEDDQAFMATRGRSFDSPLFQVATSTGLEQDAGRAAAILRLSDRTKLPTTFVSDNFDTVNMEVRKLDFTPENFRKSPAVKNWLAQKPEYTALVHGNPEELPRLMAMEEAIRSDKQLRFRQGGIQRISADGSSAQDFTLSEFYADWKLRQERGSLDERDRRENVERLQAQTGFAHTVAAGALQAWASTLGAVQQGQDDPTKFQVADDISQASVDIDPSFTGTLLRGAGSIIGDLPLMLTGGPLAQGFASLAKLKRLSDLGKWGKRAAGSLETAAAQLPLAIREGVNTYRETGSGWDGLASWGIETVVPASFGKTGVERAIIGGMSRESSDRLLSASALWLKEAGLEAVEETATELAHAIHESLSGIDPDAMSWEKLAPRLAAAGILGGAAGGAFNAPEAIGRFKESKIAALENARGGADRLRNLNKLISESSTVEASKTAFSELAQSMSEDSSIYFDASDWNELFHGKGLDPRDIARLVLDDPDAYDEALATGAPMEISMGKYASELARDHGAELAKIVRMDPSAFTEIEAETEFQDLTNLPPEELARIEREGRKQAADAAKGAADPGTAIRERVAAQLVESGMERSTADASAEPMAAYFTTIADRWNKNAAAEGRPQITAEELITKNLSRIQRAIPELLKAGTNDINDALLDRLRTGDLPNEDNVFGPSLFSFLTSRGGVQDQGTELSTMGVDNNRKPFQKSLIKSDGLTLDRAAEAAHEAGYIAKPEINLLLEAMNQEAGGSKVRIPGDVVNENGDQIRIAMLELQDWLGSQGIDLNETTNDEIKALMRQAPATDANGTEFAQVDPDAAAMADTIDIDGVQRSTLNSNGKRIGATEQQVRNFWAWFGDSKVVDDEGRPLVVYHGTAADFTEFSPDRAANADWTAKIGSFFAVDPKLSNARLELTGRNALSGKIDDTAKDGTRSIAVYLATMNPVEVSSREALDQVVGWASGPIETETIGRLRKRAGANDMGRWADKVSKEDVVQYGRSTGATGSVNSAVLQTPHTLNDALKIVDAARSSLKQKGNDGFDIANDKLYGRAFVVFDPNQIKSATSNSGAFDRSNPSILFQSDQLQAIDTSHLSQSAQDYVASLPPEQQQALASSIAYLANHPDHDGDQANLEMVASFTARKSINQYQQNTDEKRGSIQFGTTPGARASVINLFRAANLSTFLHESGHLFLEVFTDLARRPDAPQSFKDDLAAALEFMGVDSVDKIGVEQHEKFARGFEAYFYEGKAPSVGLRETFRRYLGWFTALYKAIRNLNVELTPEIRGVMDRMLASQEAILDAQQYQGITALPRVVFTSDEQYAEYLASVANVTEHAEDSLRQELMKVETRAYKEATNQARREIRSLVADEVDQQSDYIAIATLQNGTRPDGQDLPDNLRGLKLSRSDLVQTFGADALERLPGRKPSKKEARKNPNNRGNNLYSEDGMGLAEAAGLFGYRDSVELWEALVNAPDRRRFIESKTDAVMRERFPDPLTDGTIEERAQKAIHTDQRSKLLLRELRALSLRVGRTPAPVEVLRNLAQEEIGRQMVKSLRPDRYQVAERKAARDVEEALASNAPEAALQSKQRELLNHEMYRAAVKAKADSEAIFRNAKRYEKPETRKKIGLAGGWEWTVTFSDGRTEKFGVEDEAKAKAKQDPGATWDQTSGYLDQIDGLMADYEFKRISNKVLGRRGTFAEWIAARTEAGESVAIPDTILSGKAKNWRLLTIDELRALGDSLKNIEHMAKLKNKLASIQDQRDFIEVRNQLIATVEANNQRKQRLPGKEDRTMVDVAKIGIAGFVAAHTKTSQIALTADGGKEGGIFQRMLVDPVNRAGVIEAQRLSEEGVKFQRLALAHKAAGRNLNTRVEIAGLGPLSLETRIGWALNWGNKGNRERLIAGESEVSMANGKGLVTETEGQAVIDSLEQADWDFVNGLIKQIDAFWSEISSQERRMNGYAPGKVKAEPFRSRLGIQPGGYFPISYDVNRSPKNRRSKIAEQTAYVVGSAANKTTAHGHAMARSQGLGPLNLSLDVASRHITQVIHDLSYREPLADISKWMGDRRFRETIHDYFGPAKLETLEAWRGDMARRDMSQNFADRALRYVRNGVSIMTLGFNVGSAAVQIAGIGPSMQRVGVVNFARGFSRLFHNPEQAETGLKFIYGKSEFMKTRNDTMIREVREALRQLRGTGRLDSIRSAAYWMITKAQTMVDAPTWMAAYEKSLAEGKADDAAIKIADQVVADTQGSGLAADLTGVQRSQFTQLFTVFFTPAVVTFNSSANAIAEFRRAGLSPQSVGQLVLDFLTIYMIPAAITVGIKAAMGAAVGGADDDKETIKHKIAMETVASVFNNFVGVRELSGIIEGFSYSGPAGVRPIAEVGRSIQQLSQLYDGDKGGFQADQLDAGLAKALANVTGAWLHLPVRPVVQIIDGINWAEKNDKNPILPMLLGKPRR